MLENVDNAQPGCKEGQIHQDNGYQQLDNFERCIF